MSDRIATVAPVVEESATGKVAEIYADIRRTKGLDRVPNLWRVLATNPDHLELVWGRGILNSRRGSLDRRPLRSARALP